MRQLPNLLGHVVAGILSLLGAFFGVFLVLFSDIFDVSQQAGAVLYVFVVYFVFSLLLHWLWRTDRKKWVLWLVIPGGVFGLFITFSDGIWSFYPVAVLAGMVGGIWLGWWVLRRRQAPDRQTGEPE